MAKSNNKTESSLRRVHPSQARDLLVHAMSCKVPMFVWGPPGIGKSDLIASIAASQGRRLIDLRMLLMDPTDVKGIPYYNTDTNCMEWAKPSELPEIVSAESLKGLRDELARLEAQTVNGVAEDELHTKRVNRQRALVKRTERVLEFQDAILFLDELNAAAPSVQAAAYQLVLNRRVGEYVLPDGIDIIAAGNRETDKGVSYRMPSPLANRFTHIELEANVDDWVDWAINAAVHPEVIGFIKQHNHKLFAFDPSAPDKAFATPRSWHKTSTLLTGSKLSEDLNSTLVAGTIGEGMSIEFMQHRRFAERLPAPEAVLAGKAGKLEVEEISAHYTLSISICYMLKARKDSMAEGKDPKYGVKEFYENVDNFFSFIMANFKTEVVVLAARTLMRDFKVHLDISHMKTFDEFHKRFAKFIVAAK